MDIERNSWHIITPFVEGVDSVANHSAGPRRDVFAVSRDIFEVGEDIGEFAAHFTTIINGN